MVSISIFVLDLFEITPFSNYSVTVLPFARVLDLFEITPFSNKFGNGFACLLVLDLFEITPFSNLVLILLK